MSKTYKLTKFGPITQRRDYSNTKHNLPVEDLVEIQKSSFDWFLKQGLKESFESIYPITSTNGKITIEFLPKTLKVDLPRNEYEAIQSAKTKGNTFSVRITAKLRKIDNEEGTVKEQEVLFGEIPMMTSGGSFVINGSEKVIVSQLLRSPGAYFTHFTSRTSSDDLYNKADLFPRLGIWLEVYHKVTGANTDHVKISVDKKKSIPLSTFLRSFGMTKDNIRELFGSMPIIEESIKKDNKPTENEALEYIHGILRKGDRITEESKRNLYANIMFNARRYNLSKTGRYMINRKLSLTERLEDAILAEDLVAKSTNAVLFKAGTHITLEVAREIQESFEAGILPLTNIPGITSEIYGSLLELDSNKNLKKRVKVAVVSVYPSRRYMSEGKEAVNVIGTDPKATEGHIIMPDIIAALSYYFNLELGMGTTDDPDSLVNKRVVLVGELLQNQMQIALTKLERTAKERMSSKDPDKITPKNVTHNKSVFDQFKLFFNSSQLSQFMDQINPLAEISNKRRVTSLGPGGINRDTAKNEVRDVHQTHYGRLCPIETPEGQNIGLILNFANYARVNELGFVETPYYKVENGAVIKQPVYLTAQQEVGFTFAQSKVSLDESNNIIDEGITIRKDGEYFVAKPNEVDYIDVSSKQMTSVASSAIPFLENDDANRALMGANMQRQAVPLLKPEAPFVGTGIEADVAKYSAVNIKASDKGEVVYVDSETIEIKHAKKKRVYSLRTFERSNQGSMISQRPLVKVGQKVAKGELLTDATSFDNGEMALGKNVVVAFSTWRGYNFEDAIILSERLVKKDAYTSVHIEEKSIEFRKQKLGDDQLTNEIPNISKFALRNLDEDGIVRVGSEVQAGDVLVGRASPKGEDNPTPEEKLISAIFSQKSKPTKDTSLKVAHGHGGTVIDVQTLSRENGDKLQDDVSRIIKIYIAQKRKIKVGDKMAGRHGNKGVISNVLPVEDMPHLADGTPVDIMLNPQGVPSRMNIGQVLELHLGLAAKKLNIKFATPVFDGINFEEINQTLDEAELPRDGKFDLYDPISGEKFDAKVSVGVMYMLKLAHMVDDKMHSRSVGPYSLITQQPLGGKSQNGGQRFGEMETWAIEAYGATNVLQELLTYKSDNIEGRNRLYNSLVSGAPLPTPGTPESFNVLAYELRGLGMKLEVETTEKEEGDK